MGVVLMPMFPVGPFPIHLHPPHLRPPSCPHCRNHHQFLLQQQQNEQQNHEKILNVNRRIMSMRFMWMPPSCNMLKLNTDGSSKGNPGPSSFGGLIRDGNGRWLCGYMGKMKGRSFTSLEAEVWSIFQGLCLIKKMNMSNVLIETDCLEAMLLGVHDFDDEDRPQFDLILEAMNKIKIEQRCTLVHTRRDGNHCADQLAKLGGRQAGEFVVLRKPPVELIPYLTRDMEAGLERAKLCGSIDMEATLERAYSRITLQEN